MNSDNWYDIIAVNIVFQTEIFNYLRIGDDFLMDDGPVRLFAFVILFLLSAYFSGSEISLASVNKIRIANHAENGDKAAQRVLYLLENFDKASLGRRSTVSVQISVCLIVDIRTQKVTV